MEIEGQHQQKNDLALEEHTHKGAFAFFTISCQWFGKLEKIGDSVLQ